MAMVCLIFITSLYSCQSAQPPEFLGLEDVHANNLSLQQSVLAARIKFYNPNGFAIQMKKAELDIFLNNQLADHYLLDSTINIPAKDTFYVPASLRLDLRQVLNTALQSLFNKEVKIRIDGRIKLKRSGFPFSVPVHYEGSQAIDGL